MLWPQNWLSWGPMNASRPPFECSILVKWNKSIFIFMDRIFYCNFLLLVKWITVIRFPPMFVNGNDNRNNDSSKIYIHVWTQTRTHNWYVKTHKYLPFILKNLIAFQRRMDNDILNNGSNLNRITYSGTSNFLSIVAFFSLLAFYLPFTHIASMTHYYTFLCLVDACYCRNWYKAL